jgi:hypothetical protein
MHFKATEKMFFAQKFKCKFFKESDRGTSVFHALMSQKHRRNYIVFIQYCDGTLSNSMDEVGEEFVSFFKQLLGSLKELVPLNVDVVKCGQCLDGSSHALLLGPITNDDIKKALFSIGNDKALGPNGYSSLFFKKSWEMVGFLCSSKGYLRLWKAVEADQSFYHCLCSKVCKCDLR